LTTLPTPNLTQWAFSTPSKGYSHHYIRLGGNNQEINGKIGAEQQFFFATAMEDRSQTKKALGHPIQLITAFLLLSAKQTQDPHNTRCARGLSSRNYR
jgi:hypothetical protein